MAEAATPAGAKVGFRFDRPRGFDIVPRCVTLDKGLSDGAYRTYVVISSFAWWQEASMTEGGDRWCYPGLARIAEMRGQSERNVIRHIHDLCDRGWLVKERRGQGKTNRYTIITTGLTMIVQGERGDKIVTSRTDTDVTRRINRESGADAAAAGGEPAPGEQASSSDKLTAMLNVFRDLHLKHVKRKYMVEWARDKAALKRVLAAHAPDTVRGMMSIYMTMPRKKYTVVGFVAAVPELIVLLEEWRQKQARKKTLAGEVEAISRLQAAYEAEASDAVEALDALDKKLSGLTEGKGIPDPATREAINAVLEEIGGVWAGVFKRACYNAVVPDALKADLLRQIGTDWDEARSVMERAKQTRAKTGG
jgi:hypothetical protein